MFVEGCPCSRPNEAARPQFRISYVHAQSMRNDNQILHGYQTRCDEEFYRVHHKC